MKSILIVTSSYGEDSGVPCGKDMHNLALYLKKNYNMSVTVLTAGYNGNVNTNMKSEGIQIVNIPTNKECREKLALEYSKDTNFLEKILLKWELRNLNKQLDQDYFAGDAINYKNLCCWMRKRKQNKYDVILSVSYPFYIQRFAYLIRKKMKIKKWIMYLLDPYADNVHVYKDTREQRIKEERKLFKSCTNIFTAEELVTKRKYSPIIDFQEKINFIPTHLLINNTEYTYVPDSDSVNFVYAGTFYNDIRNPECLLKLFLHLPQNYVLTLYSVGCEEIIKKYKVLLGERLHVNGFVQGETEYKRCIEVADVLIDVGNTVSNQVPSKILDYCSYGKPIVHFVNCSEEVVSERFSKYPLFLSAEYEGDNDSIAQKIIDFSESVKGKRVDYSIIQKEFSQSTVEYVGGLVDGI